MGDGRPPIERACYWMARHARGAGAPLAGARRAEVAIVGAGFTGLWTAHFLKTLAPALDVVVVEQGAIAYGASGRNAGMVIDTIDHSHGLAIAHFGEDEARRLARLGRENLEALVSSLGALDVACDLARNGTLHVALSQAHVDAFGEAERDARRLGVEDLVVLDGAGTRARVASPRYVGGLYNPMGATLDPVALCLGLAASLRRRGVTIFEGSRVTSIEAGGARGRVRTGGGEIVADRVVLGTSAYTHTLVPELGRYFLPLYDYVLVSEPLDAAQREAVRWRGREGVNDGRAFFHYARLTPDDRVLFGTSEAHYHGGDRVDPSCDHSEAHYAALSKGFGETFPALEGISFPFAWGGPIDATARFTPFFGAAHGGRVVYGLGFTGHGIATTHLAGKILAHMALERRSDLLSLALVTKPPFPYPPEPLRGWAVQAVTRDLRRLDAGHTASLLLRALDALGVGLSS